MIYIFGTKSFFHKIKAYKSVWCIHCKKPVLAIKSRRFVMWHLFFIPLIPLGFRTEWHCEECKKDPNATWSLYDALGMLVLSLMFGSVFFSEKHSADLHISQEWLWGLRLVFAAGALFGISIIIKHLRPGPTKHPVEPLNNTECLACGSGINGQPDAICPSCGVMREGL